MKKVDINMNLQEQISRIKSMMLMNEDYSPSGEEYVPGKFVYHKSPETIREYILNQG